MRKNKNFSWMIILLILIMLSACSKSDVKLAEDKKEDKEPVSEVHMSKDDVEKVEINDKYITLEQFDFNYEKLEDIRPEDVPEIKLEFRKKINPIKLDFSKKINHKKGININYTRYLVKETTDGFICASLENKDGESFSEEKKVQLPTLRKMNTSGKLVWEKQLKDENLDGTLNHLIVLDNDNFLFSINNYYPIDKNYLIKCDKDGNVLWQKEVYPLGFDRISKIIVTNKDEIIIMGLGYPIESTSNHEWDILVAKLDMNGNMMKQVYFGGSNYEYLDEVKYNKNMGIVFQGRTSSTDGDFALTEETSSPVDFVACMDEDFNIQWVMNDNKAHIDYDQILVSDDEVCILGNALVSNFTYDTFFIKLSKNGDKIGEYSELSSGMWGRGAQLLPTGELVISKRSKNVVGNDLMDQVDLIIFDKNNQEVARMEDIKLIPNDIIAIHDGGFMVKAIRPIKVIPQPAYVSSIWYDQEVVIMKFDGDYNIEWRKTYDDYKGSIRIDFVEMLAKGSVLVE